MIFRLATLTRCLLAETWRKNLKQPPQTWWTPCEIWLSWPILDHQIIRGRTGFAEFDCPKASFGEVRTCIPCVRWLDWTSGEDEYKLFIQANSHYTDISISLCRGELNVSGVQSHTFCCLFVFLCEPTVLNLNKPFQVRVWLSQGNLEIISWIKQIAQSERTRRSI